MSDPFNEQRDNMIKALIMILILLWVLMFVIMFTTSWAFGQGRDCVTEQFRAEIGVREKTGQNDGERIAEYLASTGLAPGYAWCAAFVNWTLAKCGLSRAASAWSPAWFPAKRVILQRGKFVKSDPASGDVFGIYYPSKKRIAHVGFIEAWPETGTGCTTVEGNTNQAGSREGDGVYRKFRHKAQVYMVANWIDP